MSSPEASFEVVDGVGRLCLERPDHLNSQTVEMWENFADIARAIDAAKPQLRCLVVAGAGRSFCAGIDLNELATEAGALRRVAFESNAHEADPLLALIDRTQEWYRWLQSLELPTIAVVQGHALGVGLQLALACDIRVFADDAIVGLPEASHGLVPDLGAVQWLPEIVGDGVARDMILTGRLLNAEEARSVGLASRVVALCEIDRAAQEVVQAILGSTPLAMSGAKRAFGARRGVGASWRTVALAQAACIRSQESQARAAATIGRLNG